MILSKNFFSKHEKKGKLLNSRTWKTLKHSAVISQIFETQFPPKTSKITYQNFSFNQETQFDWFCAKAEWKVHGYLEKDLQKIVSLVKEKLVVVIDRVRYLPLSPEPKGQFTPIIFFLTNPGTPREKKGQKLLLKF